MTYMTPEDDTMSDTNEALIDALLPNHQYASLFGLAQRGTHTIEYRHGDRLKISVVYEVDRATFDLITRDMDDVREVADREDGKPPFWNADATLHRSERLEIEIQVRTHERPHPEVLA